MRATEERPPPLSRLVKEAMRMACEGCVQSIPYGDVFVWTVCDVCVSARSVVCAVCGLGSVRGSRLSYLHVIKTKQ